MEPACGFCSNPHSLVCVSVGCQDLPRIRTLAMVYTLAGADCIDVSANEAVVTTAIEVRGLRADEHTASTRPL